MSTVAVDNITDEVGTSSPDFPNGILKSSLPAGSVIQVVSATKTNTFTTSSESFVLVPGLQISITPFSTDNKILVIVNIGAAGNGTANYGSFFALGKNSSVLSDAIGDADGIRTQTSFAVRQENASSYSSQSISYLDSPSSVSSISYQVFTKREPGAGFVTVNRSGVNSDATARALTISSVTAMEIAG